MAEGQEADFLHGVGVFMRERFAKPVSFPSVLWVTSHFGVRWLGHSFRRPGSTGRLVTNHRPWSRPIQSGVELPHSIPFRRLRILREGKGSNWRDLTSLANAARKPKAIARIHKRQRASEHEQRDAGDDKQSIAFLPGPATD